MKTISYSYKIELCRGLLVVKGGRSGRGRNVSSYLGCSKEHIQKKPQKAISSGAVRVDGVRLQRF
jgi:hypothetical protein